MRIAVDVMGGDDAPDAILKGCFAGLEHLSPEDTLALVGPRGAIEETLSEHGVDDARLEIVDAPDVIDMGESPAMAVRSKPDSSIVRMAYIGSHRTDLETRADAVISAGNTGACVTAGIMQMKRLPGVHRPGIAVVMPSFHGDMILCDAGANPEPKATHLWQYGIMGEALARKLLGMPKPRVALLNIGSEEGKGTGIIKETRDLLRATPGIDYVGYIEGRSLFSGVADVVVTDGFLGNAMLKTAEGLASSIFKAITQEIVELDPELMLRFEPIARAIYAKNDYHTYGGAPLLGVNGTMFIAHGSSEPRTIANAIRTTRQYVSLGVNEEMARRVAECEALEQPVDA
ncbi:MAG: phosphate acyltransferase PlsX [Planctomycetota bacterium]